MTATNGMGAPAPEAPALTGGMDNEMEGGMKTFYAPGNGKAKVGDVVSFKVVSIDKDNGDLELAWAEASPAMGEYTPEEPPADAFQERDALI